MKFEIKQSQYLKAQHVNRTKRYAQLLLKYWTLEIGINFQVIFCLGFKYAINTVIAQCSFGTLIWYKTEKQMEYNYYLWMEILSKEGAILNEKYSQ